MGDRGWNAGGFAYMEIAACPKCGRKRKWGRRSIEMGLTECSNREDCRLRQEKQKAKETDHD